MRLNETIGRKRNSLAGICKAEGGTVLPLFGLAIFAVIGATGIAIDYGRAAMMQSKLHAAIDAAGLAAAAVSGSRNTAVEVQKFAEANFPQGYMGVTYTVTGLGGGPASIDGDTGALDVQAQGKVSTTFMNIFGIRDLDVVAYTQVKRGQPSRLEFVMALDVTGSMAGSKIVDLRNAATNMLNILYDPSLDTSNTWVSVVPYTTAVNVGSDKTAWIRNYDVSTAKYPAGYPAGEPKWKGCVESRTQYPVTNGLDLSEAIPNPSNPATLFPQYYWASQSPNRNNDWLISGVVQPIRQSAGGYTNASASGPNVTCPTPVVPFTTTKNKLQTAVNALVAWPRGGTSSLEGISWAWRVISPDWGALWGHDGGMRPAAYNEQKATKAVMIMTDGINDIYTQATGSGDGESYMGSDYFSYGHIGESKLGAGVTTKSAGLNAVNAKFAQVCSNMKARGITIYAVTFQLGNSAAHNTARNLFRNCASKPEFYFDSPSGAALEAAFAQIADSLITLTISR